MVQVGDPGHSMSRQTTLLLKFVTKTYQQRKKIAILLICYFGDCDDSKSHDLFSTLEHCECL